MLRNTRKINNGLDAWKDELKYIAQLAGVDTYIFYEIHARRIKAAIRCADAMKKANDEIEARIAALEAQMKDTVTTSKFYSAPQSGSGCKNLDDEAGEDVKPYTDPYYINSEGYLAPASFEEWSKLEPTWDKNSTALSLLQGGLDMSDLEAIKEIQIASHAFQTIVSRHK
jgi:hypothetical protein